MQIKKLFLTSLMAVGMIGATAVSPVVVHADFGDLSQGKSQLSYKQAKKHWSHVYKLAFFDNEASDADSQYYKLGWYRNGKLKQYTLDSDDDSWQEIIDPNLKTPYVVFNGGTDGGANVAIHRPPYNMYNQPAVSGKVTAKVGD